MPKISVIIPCFNQAHYLEMAVDSVIEQSYRDCEIIIVNDGSTDNTSEVMNRLEGRSTVPVISITQENKGLSMAREAGLHAANGEYLVQLDADDVMEPGVFDQMARICGDDPGLDILAGRALFVDASNSTSLLQAVPGNQVVWPDILRSNPIPVPAVAMVRVGSVRKIGGLGLEGARACEDWDLWARFARCRMKYRTINRIVARYRQHEGALSNKIGLMFDETCRLLERSAKPDPRIEAVDPDPCAPLGEEQLWEFRDGHVFYALGSLSAIGPDKVLEQSLMEKYRGSFDYRWFMMQFVQGFRRMLLSRGKADHHIDMVRVDKVVGILGEMLSMHGHEARFRSFRRELYWELKHPFRRWSARRRLSRMLDGFRQFRK